jgi:hypothetical protein
MTTSLEYFLLRATKLENSNFWKWLNTRREQSDIGEIIEGNWLAHDKLNPEELEAFCLNLRFLIQPRDGISYEMIAEIASFWPDTYEVERKGVKDAAARLNLALDSKAMVSMSPEKKTTNRELFEIIFYGEIAHANPGKREQFKTLVSSGLFSYFVFNTFCSVLFHYRNCIQSVAHFVARYVLAENARKHAALVGVLNLDVSPVSLMKM